MNINQLISTLMARERVINTVWDMLDNETKGQLK